MTRVNIIIPVHNRPVHTFQTIKSLFDNTKKELFDLYVYNDASDNATTEVLVNLKNTYPCKMFANFKPMGPAWCRNQVAKYITEKTKRADYLYHSDNDVFFTDGWLSKLTEAMGMAETLGVKVLGGSCHPYLQNKEVITVRNGYDGKTYNIGQKDAVSGYSQLMTWETWDRYGPFDEEQGSQEKKIMGSEDWAFCQRVVKAGFVVGSIEPEVVIPCGKTNTYGDPATGSDTFKEFEGVMVL